MKRHDKGPEAKPGKGVEADVEVAQGPDVPSTEAEIEPGINHEPSSAESFSSEPPEEAAGKE